jgi:hypothetical protein
MPTNDGLIILPCPECGHAMMIHMRVYYHCKQRMDEKKKNEVKNEYSI